MHIPRLLLIIYLVKRQYCKPHFWKRKNRWIHFPHSWLVNYSENFLFKSSFILLKISSQFPSFFCLYKLTFLYQIDFSSWRNHLQSQINGRTIHVFFSKVADKCATEVSAVIIKSKFLIILIVSSNGFPVLSNLSK